MIHPDRNAFREKTALGNLIPVWTELLADQDTPVSAYERLQAALRAPGQPLYTFLLESVEGGEHIGRFSFIGGAPRAVLESREGTVRITETGAPPRTVESPDPLSALRDHMSRYRAVPDPALPRFFGGAVGYLGYDAVARFERVPIRAENGLGWPDMVFIVADTILIFDRVRHTLKVVTHAFVEGDADRAYDEACARIEKLCEDLARPLPHNLIHVEELDAPIEPRSNMSRADFEASVRRAKEYIRAGDIVQVVLSQRFEADNPGSPLDVYRAIRSINPSPYMFCLDFADWHMVGSSPEVHVRCEDGQAELRPIAGTRPRADNPDEDRRLADELLADPKERAEHIMLVDLARNDLGRVCAFGSVRVPELMTIERYSHVMHIVSDVTGVLQPGHDAYDVMRSTFPAGTVSGAPKIRAMEIVADLEPARRGPYAGAVGYFSFTGNLDSCITIRTVLIHGDKAYVQAGAGIVADSDPPLEYEETRNKARGMLKAIAVSQRYAAARRQTEPAP